MTDVKIHARTAVYGSSEHIVLEVARAAPALCGLDCAAGAVGSASGSALSAVGVRGWSGQPSGGVSGEVAVHRMVQRRLCDPHSIVTCTLQYMRAHVSQ